MTEIELLSGTMQLNVLRSEMPLEKLCGFASRQNPKRGFLFVSKVLGKHYPVRPNTMQFVYDRLAERLRDENLTGKKLFLGFAETATGLGAGVFDSYQRQHGNSWFMHTTRYHLNRDTMFVFEEEHSHATGHIMYQPESCYLENLSTLVLIDDEITTGNTVKNFLEQFVTTQPNINRIVVVSIISWLSTERAEMLRNLLPNIEVSFVSLLEGEYNFVKRADYVCEPMPNVDGNREKKDSIISGNHGRFGVDNFNQYDFSKMTDQLDRNKTTLVIGTGEFHYPPYLLARHLENIGFDVHYQSTTRSPILIGHDVQHKLTFLDNYSDNITNFIYNVQPDQYEQTVVCYETNGKFGCDLDQKLNSTNLYFTL